MVEQEDTELTSPNTYIKNTSTNGTIPTEPLQNTGRRLQIPEKDKKDLHVTGQDEREKKRKWDGNCGLGRELKKGKVPVPWEAPSLAGRSVQKGCFRGSEKGTATGLWQTEERETYLNIRVNTLLIVALDTGCQAA